MAQALRMLAGLLLAGPEQGQQDNASSSQS